MGTIDFVDIFDVRDQVYGASRPVGKIDNVVLTSATEIERSTEDVEGYGRYVFGGEVPLTCVEISRQGEQPGVAVRRKEFKSLTDGSEPRIKEGATLIVAQAPHSGYWVTVKPFLRWRRSDVRPEILETATNIPVLQEAMAASDRDLFETRKGVLTAAVEEDEYRIFLRPSAKAQYRGLCQVMGVVQDTGGSKQHYDAVEMEIFQSKRIQSTIKAISAGAPLGPNRNLFLPKRLVDELPSLMAFSIRQALAGPGSEQNADEFVGTPVGRYARHLFMDHAHNLTRTADETRREMFADLDVLEAGDAVQNQIASFFALHFS